MNWRRIYNRETKDLIKAIFNKYKSCRLISDKEVRQNLVSNYEGERVQSSINNKIEDKIISKADADVFVKRIDDLLRQLPALYRKLIINCYIREQTDVENYMNLGLPERTFYRCKGEAVRMIADELIARKIEVN